MFFSLVDFWDGAYRVDAEFAAHPLCPAGHLPHKEGRSTRGDLSVTSNVEIGAMSARPADLPTCGGDARQGRGGVSHKCRGRDQTAAPNTLTSNRSLDLLSHFRRNPLRPDVLMVLEEVRCTVFIGALVLIHPGQNLRQGFVIPLALLDVFA